MAKTFIKARVLVAAMDFEPNDVALLEDFELKSAEGVWADSSKAAVAYAEGEGAQARRPKTADGESETDLATAAADQK